MTRPLQDSDIVIAPLSLYLAMHDDVTRTPLQYSQTITLMTNEGDALSLFNNIQSKVEENLRQIAIQQGSAIIYTGSFSHSHCAAYENGQQMHYLSWIQTYFVPT